MAVRIFGEEYGGYSASAAATSAPSSQQASRSGLPGGPVTQTGGRTACHRSPPVIDSTARTAPPVSSRRAAIQAKLGVRNRVEIAAWAWESRLVGGGGA